MVILEVLEDTDPSIRELALLLISEMLKNQVSLLIFHAVLLYTKYNSSFL